jgi:hypothetical protein
MTLFASWLLGDSNRDEENDAANRLAIDGGRDACHKGRGVPRRLIGRCEDDTAPGYATCRHT